MLYLVAYSCLAYCVYKSVSGKEKVDLASASYVEDSIAYHKEMLDYFSALKKND